MGPGQAVESHPLPPVFRALGGRVPRRVGRDASLVGSRAKSANTGNDTRRGRPDCEGESDDRRCPMVRRHRLGEPDASGLPDRCRRQDDRRARLCSWRGRACRSLRVASVDDRSRACQTDGGLAFKEPKTKAGRRVVSIPPSVAAEMRNHCTSSGSTGWPWAGVGQQTTILSSHARTAVCGPLTADRRHGRREYRPLTCPRSRFTPSGTLTQAN